MPIPNKIFAVWLGGLPPEDGLTNMEAWLVQNKDHEGNLVIDTRLYPKPMSEEFESKYQAFLKRAKEKNIRIRDIGNPDAKQDYVLYENMPCKNFYDHEVGLSKPSFCLPHEKLETNFAAASDIVRVEFLYHEGGKYFDFRDILTPTGPQAKSLKELEVKEGFLCREHREFVVNDFLASEPKGEILSKYRDAIHQKYLSLYRDPMDTRAHYNTYFQGPYLIDRRQSTVNTSGPQNLADITDDINSKNIFFPKEYYSLLTTSNAEAGQIHDWYKPNDEKHYQEIVRNYARFYLQRMLIKTFPHTLLNRVTNAPEELHNLLFSYPLDWKMTQMVEHCKAYEYKHIWSSEEKLKLNTLLDEVATFANRLEIFFNHLNEIADSPAGHLLAAVKSIREIWTFMAFRPSSQDYNQLFDALIMENQGKPSMETLQEFMPDLKPKPEQSNTLTR